MEPFDVSHEIAKAAITFAFVAVLGGAAGLLWAKARHRRELDLSALAEFYRVYGSWFATWKAWESAWDDKQIETERGPLLKQATLVEGQFEALLVRIASERRLSTLEIDRLGRFRQGYQQLRESIEKKKRLPFRVRFDDAEVKAYVAFKSLSVDFAGLLHGRRARAKRLRLALKAWGRPTVKQSQEAFVKITSWRVDGDLETSWWAKKGSTSATNAVEAWKGLR
jgi:hypothetical protein